MDTKSITIDRSLWEYCIVSRSEESFASEADYLLDARSSTPILLTNIGLGQGDAASSPRLLLSKGAELCSVHWDAQRGFALIERGVAEEAFANVGNSIFGGCGLVQVESASGDRAEFVYCHDAVKILKVSDFLEHSKFQVSSAKLLNKRLHEASGVKEWREDFPAESRVYESDKIVNTAEVAEMPFIDQRYSPALILEGRLRTPIRHPIMRFLGVYYLMVPVVSACVKAVRPGFSAAGGVRLIEVVSTT